MKGKQMEGRRNGEGKAKMITRRDTENIREKLILYRKEGRKRKRK